jgi:hypothetical protein
MRQKLLPSGCIKGYVIIYRNNSDNVRCREIHCISFISKEKHRITPRDGVFAERSNPASLTVVKTWWRKLAIARAAHGRPNRRSYTATARFCSLTSLCHLSYCLASGSHSEKIQMVKHTLEQRTFLYDCYVKKKSYIRRISRNYPGFRDPDSSAIFKLVKLGAT